MRRQIVLGLPNCLWTLVGRGQVQVELAVVEHLWTRERVRGWVKEEEEKVFKYPLALCPVPVTL